MFGALLSGITGGMASGAQATENAAADMNQVRTSALAMKKMDQDYQNSVTKMHLEQSSAMTGMVDKISLR